MNPPLELDALLIGHGLAGGVLAHVLGRAGWRVLVIDQPQPDSASRVAAGLVNPLAGRRFALSWRAEELLPAAAAFYRSVEEEVGGGPFWHPRPIHKFFATVEEANTGMGKADGATPFIEAVLPPTADAALHAPLGGLRLGGGGFLHTEPLLDALIDCRRQKGEWRGETFSFDRLVSGPGGIRYALADGTPVAARYLVCCEGAAATANPFFHWLPLVPNKGEVLDVALPAGLPPDVVYNQGVYLVPHGQHRWRVGATYDYNAADAAPSAAGREQLLTRLARLTPLPAVVVGHRAGRRPAVRDRRPLVGPHPAHPRVVLFNGFGSKGVGLAPGLAWHLLAVLEERETLWPEVNIARFGALYPG